MVIDTSDVCEQNPHSILCDDFSTSTSNFSLECPYGCAKYNKNTFESFTKAGPEGYMPSYMFLPSGDIPPFFYDSDGRRWSMPKMVLTIPVEHPYFKGQFYEDIVSGKFVPK